jgi:predicted RNA-binding Zn ribbon-like protein
MDRRFQTTSPALELVNSEVWYGAGSETRRDELAASGWLDAYLEHFALGAHRPTPRQRAELVRLRALLRRLVTTTVQRSRLDQPDIDELNRFVGMGSLMRRLVADADSCRLEVVSADESWRSVLSAVATSFAELLEGEPERIKLCANEPCGCAFYDESKNRRRRWCGASSCGPADKIRRFRQRQRAATSKRAA